MQRFSIFKAKAGKGADRHSKEIKFGQLLSGMGFRPENIHYAKTSLHEGFPEKAWYFPRPDDDRESLALVALYEDGNVILREYQADGSKPENSTTFFFRRKKQCQRQRTKCLKNSSQS